MKKSFLSFAVALLLFPQFAFSQDSMDVNQRAPLEVSETVATNDELTAKGGEDLLANLPMMGSLTSFELVDGSTNSMKIKASFLQNEAFVLKIYNAAGISIYQEAFETDDLSLAMGFSSLPDGEYFISLTTKDGEVVKPFK